MYSRTVLLKIQLQLGIFFIYKLKKSLLWHPLIFESPHKFKWEAVYFQWQLFPFPHKQLFTARFETCSLAEKCGFEKCAIVKMIRV